MKRSLLVLLVLALLAAGCGSDDDEASGSPSSSTADGATADDAVAEGDSGAKEGSSDDPAADVVVGEGSDTDFCATNDELDESMSSVMFGDAGQLEDTLEEVRGTIEDLPDQAPDEIRDEVETVVDGFIAFVDALADADYDFLAIDPEITARFEDDSALAEAGDRIAAFCGADISDALPAPDLGELDFSEVEGIEDLTGIDGGQLKALECFGTEMESLMGELEAGREPDIENLAEECGLDPSSIGN